MQDNAKVSESMGEFVGHSSVSISAINLYHSGEKLDGSPATYTNRNKNKKRQTAQRDQLNLDIAQPPLQKNRLPSCMAAQKTNISQE